MDRLYSEQTLPYARALGINFKSELTLISVPAVPEGAKYRAPSNVINTIREKAVTNMKKFTEAVARSLREDNLEVNSIVTGSFPAQTIVELGEKDDVDLIMITSQGPRRAGSAFHGFCCSTGSSKIQ